MYLCYIDESGTSDIPGNTSHFVLAGLSIPIWHWRNADRGVSAILRNYDLEGEELHTAWLSRSYLEQSRIPNFEKLSRTARRSAVQRERNAHLLQLQQAHNSKTYRQVKKNHRHTNAYIHLTFNERRTLISEVADCVANWGLARLFAECIDKIYFEPSRTRRTIDEQAFEQIVSRFETFLTNISQTQGQRTYGLLVHDSNETIETKHTKLMRQYHEQGTLWTKISHIIETPLFVDSSLTSMVQIADLCSYALRRFVENGETALFDTIFQRADRVGENVVGVRHFADMSCACAICSAHRSAQ